MSGQTSWKNMILGWIFDAKMGGLERREPSWRSILVAKYEVSVVREKASKIRANITSKNHKNRALGTPAAVILHFL